MVGIFYVAVFIAFILLIVVVHYFPPIYGELQISGSIVTYKDHRGAFILTKENMLNISWGIHSLWKKRYYKITILTSETEKIRGFFFETETEAGGSISAMIGRLFEEKPYPTLKKLIELGLYNPKPEDSFYLGLKLKSKE